MASYPNDIYLWLILVMRRECQFSDGIGGGSGDETLGSETGIGHHLLKPAERNEPAGANRHGVGDRGGLHTVGGRMSGSTRQKQSFRK